MSSRVSDAAATPRPAPDPASGRAVQSTPARALALPLGFTVLLIALSFIPAVRNQPVLRWSFRGASAALFLWNVLLLWSARRRHRTLAIEVSLRKQHYIQACAHFSFLVYHASTSASARSSNWPRGVACKSIWMPITL